MTKARWGRRSVDVDRAAIHKTLRDERNNPEFARWVVTFLIEHTREIEKRLVRAADAYEIANGELTTWVRAAVVNLATDLRWQRIYNGRNAVLSLRGNGWIPSGPAGGGSSGGSGRRTIH